MLPFYIYTSLQGVKLWTPLNDPRILIQNLSDFEPLCFLIYSTENHEIQRLNKLPEMT